MQLVELVRFHEFLFGIYFPTWKNNFLFHHQGPSRRLPGVGKKSIRNFYVTWRVSPLPRLSLRNIFSDLEK